MLGADQKPRPQLFVAHGQHMSPEGYKVWARLVRPASRSVLSLRIMPRSMGVHVNRHKVGGGVHVI